MIYFNANPMNRRTGDCVIRAFSVFLGTTWRKAFMELIEWCADRGYVLFNYRSVYNKYLEEKGYKKTRAPFKGITVAQFVEHYAQEYNLYMLQCPRHVTIIRGKELVDTWDCSHLEVQGFWIRKAEL